jgi:hypothetical protein
MGLFVSKGIYFVSLPPYIIPIMLKLLITGFLIYFMYRFFIAPVMLGTNDDDAPNVQTKEPQKKAKDDDYIDYEEVD